MKKLLLSLLAFAAFAGTQIFAGVTLNAFIYNYSGQTIQAIGNDAGQIIMNFNNNSVQGFSNGTSIKIVTNNGAKLFLTAPSNGNITIQESAPYPSQNQNSYYLTYNYGTSNKQTTMPNLSITSSPNTLSGLQVSLLNGTGL